MSDILDRALAAATDTRRIVLGSDVLDRTGPVFAETVPGARATIVADETTWALAGEPVAESLAAAGVELAEPLVFPASPTVFADYDNTVRVREHLERTGAHACSVGSGTLNDLTKLASGELGRGYVHVCTAASMDGYTAFGAAITRDGFKITRECPAPVGVIADLTVMASAPPRMLANGYGDLIDKFTGGADWIVADELGIEPIDPAVWSLVQDPLRAALGDPDALVAGDPAALERLVEELMLSGLAIQAHQSSRPGAGAGHHFSHQWEMEGHGLDWDPPLSHGAKVAIGTLAMASLFDLALRLDLDELDVNAIVAAWPSREANEQRVRASQEIPAIREAAVAHAHRMYVPASDLPERIRAIQRAWPRIKRRVHEQLPPAAELRDLLERIGAPTHPTQIGISPERFKRTFFQAKVIRSRYTLLDLLYEVGLLDDLVDRLFAPGGFWSPAAGR